jgi:hypothetical protein
MEEIRMIKTPFARRSKAFNKELTIPLHTKSMSAITTSSDFFRNKTTRNDESPNFKLNLRGPSALDFDSSFHSPSHNKIVDEEQKRNKRLFFKIKKAIIRTSQTTSTKMQEMKGEEIDSWILYIKINIYTVVEKFSEVVMKPVTQETRSSQGISPNTNRRRGILDEYNQDHKLNTIVKILKLKGDIGKSLKIADLEQTLKSEQVKNQ